MPLSLVHSAAAVAPLAPLGEQARQVVQVPLEALDRTVTIDDVAYRFDRLGEGLWTRTNLGTGQVD